MGVTNKTGFDWVIGFLDHSITITHNNNKLQYLIINLQPNPSSSTAEDLLHSHSLSLWFKSELLYDWRFIANQFVLATSPLTLAINNFIFQLNTCGYSPYVTSSLTRGWVYRLQLLLVLAIAVILRSESSGRARFQYLYPPGRGWPGYSPSTGFPFRRLLQLAGLRWRYSPLIWVCSILLIYSRGEPKENIRCLALDVLYWWVVIFCGLVYPIVP
jgi:hypothetical protein